MSSVAEAAALRRMSLAATSRGSERATTPTQDLLVEAVSAFLATRSQEVRAFLFAFERRCAVSWTPERRVGSEPLVAALVRALEMYCSVDERRLSPPVSNSDMSPDTDTIPDRSSRRAARKREVRRRTLDVKLMTKLELKVGRMLYPETDSDRVSKPPGSVELTISSALRGALVKALARRSRGQTLSSRVLARQLAASHTPEQVLSDSLGAYVATADRGLDSPDPW